MSSKICVAKIPEREKKEKSREAIFLEIMAQNFSKISAKHTFKKTCKFKSGKRKKLYKAAL